MSATVLQLDLFRSRPERIDTEKRPPRDWDRDAREFFDRHPEVYRYFEQTALAALQADPKYVSAKWCWEECRKRFGKCGVRLNNNYAATAAARFREAHPEHAKAMRSRKDSSTGKEKSAPRSGAEEDR